MTKDEYFVELKNMIGPLVKSFVEGGDDYSELLIQIAEAKRIGDLVRIMNSAIPDDVQTVTGLLLIAALEDVDWPDLDFEVKTV